MPQTKKPLKPDTVRKKKAAASDVVNANRVQLFKIPADQIMDAVKDLPDEQAIPLKWLGKYCHDKNLGKTQMSTLLKKPNGGYYGYDSIYATLTGGRMRRGENILPLIDAIETLRSVEMQRAELVTSGYIHTRLSCEIWKRCDKCRLRQRIGFIFGDSQIGKTESLKEYQRRNNHGQTIYVEMPEGGSLGAFLKELAVEFGIPPETNASQLSRRLIKSFDHTMLLIVDEAHNSLKTRRGLAAMAFLRRLWNKARCGIVISVTNEGRDLLLNGPHSKELQQLWRRRIQPLQLPSVPPADDLNLFAAAYGLEPAENKKIMIKIGVETKSGRNRTKSHTHSPLKLQTDIVATEGLGVWISLLQDASDIAQDLGKEITWGAVIKAHCIDQADGEMIK